MMLIYYRMLDVKCFKKINITPLDIAYFYFDGFFFLHSLPIYPSGESKAPLQNRERNSEKKRKVAWQDFKFQSFYQFIQN